MIHANTLNEDTRDNEKDRYDYILANPPLAV